MLLAIPDYGEPVLSIGHIGQYFAKDACETSAYASITARQHYGNDLRHGLPGTLTERLQEVQNSTA